VTAARRAPGRDRLAARSEMVRRVAERMAVDLGREATDAEVARMLARSTASIARLRRGNR